MCNLFDIDEAHFFDANEIVDFKRIFADLIDSKNFYFSHCLVDIESEKYRQWKKTPYICDHIHQPFTTPKFPIIDPFNHDGNLICLRSNSNESLIRSFLYDLLLKLENEIKMEQSSSPLSIKIIVLLTVVLEKHEKLSFYLENYGNCFDSSFLFLLALQNSDVKSLELSYRHNMENLRSNLFILRHSYLHILREGSRNALKFLMKNNLMLTPDGTLPIHYFLFTPIVHYRPEIMKAIVRYSPVDHLDALNCGVLGFSCSPLFIAIYKLAKIATNSPKRKAELHNSVLPLLKAGAKITPDIFSDTSARYYLIRRKLVEDEQLHQVVAVARQSYGLKPKVLMQEFGTSLPSIYPGTLMQICRVKILKMLPKGLKTRENSICELKLPLCLENYLNLNDILFC